MELQDDILKGFSDALLTASTPSVEGTRSVYATAVKDATGLYVRFDGSSARTPATSLVECGNGDRVLATWKGHTAVITGNISYPSLTRVGAIYITLTADGLVIGELNSSNVPVGYYILIKPADSSDGKPGVEIIDTNGNVVSYFGTFSQIGATGKVRAITTNTGLRIIDDKINSANSVDKIVAKFEDTVQIGLKQKPHVWITNSELQICDSSNYIQAKFGAETVIGYSNNNRVTIDDQTVSIYVGSSTTASASFGSVTTIGKTNGRHVQITSSAVNIRYNDTNLATFTENKISLAQGAATFSSTSITLGNSDSAIISMCNNNARMAYNDENKFFLISGSSKTKYLDVTNQGDGYYASLVLNTDGDATLYSKHIAGLQLGGVADNTLNNWTNLLLTENGIFANTSDNEKPFYLNGKEIITVGNLFSSRYKRTSVSVGPNTNATVRFTMDSTEWASNYMLMGLRYAYTDNKNLIVTGNYVSASDDDRRIEIYVRNISSSAITTDVRISYYVLKYGNGTNMTYPTEARAWYYTG